ncbi:MAG: adenosine deaminase, partial [Lachnospiraceae bacterium]
PEETHPVKKLLDRGICVTINTDNMTVSGTSLTREYDNLMKNYGFTEEDILKVQENARRASFIKD